MSGTVVVTGAGGLIGSESVRHFAGQGYSVIGIDNDMRSVFFGPSASTRRVIESLSDEYETFENFSIDIRDADAVTAVFRDRGDVELVIHAAAQPSHDWAARDPHADFGINATATLNLLEATRHHAPEATFIFTSTNKVYGDRPNGLPLVELESRFDLDPGHAYYDGIDSSMSIDSSLHSLFGVSKTAADLMVQEYGRYFGTRTVCFRGGCLTGPRHAGAELHGFLSYLMRCAVTGTTYSIFGYSGKQVRDNIHSADLVAAFSAFHADPRPGAVYNIGGGRANSCSVLEAIDLCEGITGAPLSRTMVDQARIGDHKWWISSLHAFERDFPAWSITRDLESTLREIHDANAEHWLDAAA